MCSDLTATVLSALQPGLTPVHRYSTEQKAHPLFNTRILLHFRGFNAPFEAGSSKKRAPLKSHFSDVQQLLGFGLPTQSMGSLQRSIPPVPESEKRKKTVKWFLPLWTIHYCDECATKYSFPVMPAHQFHSRAKLSWLPCKPLVHTAVRWTFSF